MALSGIGVRDTARIIVVDRNIVSVQLNKRNEVTHTNLRLKRLENELQGRRNLVIHVGNEKQPRLL